MGLKMRRFTSIVLLAALLAPTDALHARLRPQPPLRAAAHNNARHPSPVLVASPVVKAAGAIGAANVLGFGISALTGWHYHLDLLGTGVFAIAAFVTRGITLAQQCSAFAVGLWASKLAGFLFYRALLTKRDMRLEDTLSTTSGQVGFWVISFAWGWLVSLPHTLAAGVPVAERPPFGAVHVIGLTLFAAGFFVETAADWQKWLFKANDANRGKFCDVGVWRLTQHPNWFGNLLLWAGIFTLNAPTLLAVGPAATLGPLTIPAWLGTACRFGTAAISPLFLLALFNGQATGVPPLNKGYDMTIAKFGSDPTWQAYNKVTPALIPTLKSVGAWLKGSYA